VGIGDDPTAPVDDEDVGDAALCPETSQAPPSGPDGAGRIAGALCRAID
jgi:hypothetical protein